MSNTNFGRWYQGVRVPYRYGAAALYFTSRVAGFTAAIAGDPSIRVRWHEDAGTAFADREKGLIVINPNFLSDNEAGSTLRSKFVLNDVENTIAVTIGIVVHEALHFRLSPNTIDDLLPNTLKGNKFAGNVSNLTEDLFIEGYCVDNFKNISWAILDVWNAIFPKSYYEERATKWNGEQPKSMQEVSFALAVMCAWKNQSLVFPLRSAFEEKLYELFYSVLRMSSWQERIALNEEIYNLLVSCVVKDEDEGEDEDKGEGEGEGNPLESEAPSEKEKKRIIAQCNTGRNTEEALGVNTPKTGEETVRGYTVILRDVNAGGVSSNFKERPEWAKFASITSCRSAVRSVRGLPKLSGKRIGAAENLLFENDNKYGRIYTDRKIEAQYGKVGEGLPQVMFMLDCSGSMRSKGKLKNTLEMAYSAVKSLGSANVPVSVFGFSTGSDFSDDTQPVILKFKGWDGSYKSALKVIDSAEGTIDLGGTPLDAAIAWGSKHFKNNNGTRIMIVISDGEADWRGIMSGDGTEEVEREVKAARAMGINVFAVSIDDSAVYYNDKSFGAPFNIKSDDPNMALSIIKKVMG